MKIILVIALSFVLIACSGIRKSPQGFTTHAESIRVLGFAFPEDDKLVAHNLVPAGAEIVTATSSPADWTSVLGVIGNVLWIGHTQISGTHKGTNSCSGK